MRLDRLRRALRSIRFRLLLVILVSGIGIHILVLSALFAHRTIMSDAFRKSVAQYIHYLAKDLGSPPDLDRARELAERTAMTIHYFSPELNWSTSGKPPSYPMERLHTWHREERIQAGVFRGRHFFSYTEGPESKLVFEMARNPDQDRRLGWVGPLLILLVTLVLIASYRWVRHIMAPLDHLMHGVRQVGAGHLEHRVPVARSDELGELASAFNHMAERVRHLIRSKERMLLDVSHELRSPLTRMKVSLAMSPDGALKESLGEEIAEMERMVTAILANARAQSQGYALEREWTDLTGLIRDEVKLCRDQPPGVLYEEPEGAVQVMVDPEKIKTVVRNVLGNAIKYSRETSGPVAVRLLEEPESALVEIEDEGIGIPEQDLPFVFEAFYRVDQSRSRETGGFGLGLSVCKATMEAHGGSINLESTPGKGTRVQLRFPREDFQPLSVSMADRD